MIELTRTNDPVLLSWLTCHLEREGVAFVVFDVHTSILEGSIGAIPRRVMILADHEAEAREVLGQYPSSDGHNVESQDISAGFRDQKPRLPDPVTS